MSKKLIEQLHPVGFATQAKRIEELERDLLNLVCRIHRDGGHYIAKYGEAKAIADADIVAAQNNADLDALQADNARLREALEYCVTQVGELATVPGIASALSSTPEQSIANVLNQLKAQINKLRESTELLLIARQIGHYRDEWDMLKEALAATPEQPIAEYRNKVIEAFVNEFSRHVGGDGEFWLHELQDFAMKEQST